MNVRIPLIEGQRLKQPTFHARYEAMPEGTWAELINGVVIMHGRVGHVHGWVHATASYWLSCYSETTLGAQVLSHATTILSDTSELQPDLQLRILPEFGGRTRTPGQYIVGPPELVVEVSDTTRFVDLGPKRDDYARAGVLEYVVLALEPDEVIWHVLQDGRFTEILPNADGLYRSRVFPGLWLDPRALYSGDTRRLREVVDLGSNTPEHAAFVERLEGERGIR